MESTRPPGHLGPIGRLTGGLVTLITILTGIVQLYQWLNDKPQTAQLQLPQQPLRVELVNLPAVTPPPAALAAPIAPAATPPVVADVPAPSPASPPPAVTSPPVALAVPVAPASTPPVVADVPAHSPASPPPAVTPVTSAVAVVTPPAVPVSVAAPMTVALRVPPPSFAIAAVTSTNETEGPRGHAALSFDGDPATFYTFMAKSDPTVITVAPKRPGTALKELRYKNPSGIQFDNLVTDFIVDAEMVGGDVTSFRFSVDLYRENWQSIALPLDGIANLKLRPQVRYNGRLMSAGEIDLR